MAVSDKLLSEIADCAASRAGIPECDRDKPQVVFENDDFSVVIIHSITSLKGALSLMREGFYPHESICNGVKLGKDLLESEVPQNVNKNQLNGEQGIAELELLSLEAAKDGISLVAIEKSSGKLAGATFNKVQNLSTNGEKGFFESFRDERCQSASALALINTMIKMDSLFNVFEHYEVSTALEIMFLATHPEFRNRGIGKMLVKSSFEEAKARGILLAVALMTSVYTQRIAHSVGMEVLAEVSHDQLNFYGDPMSNRTGIHKSTTLVAKKLI